MPKSNTRKKKAPKRVLALPDLEHAKTAVLNTLTSASGQRTCERRLRLIFGSLPSGVSRMRPLMPAS